MVRSKTASVLVLLLCSPLAAETISGTVYLDPPALAVRADFIPAPASVKLYRDGGSAPLAETATASGRYEFTGLSAGTYEVVVDSKSIGKQVWAEQTFGPAGAVCAQTNGTTRTNFFEGACVGGR